MATAIKTPVIYDECGYIDEDATFAAALTTAIREWAEWGDYATRFGTETFAGGIEELYMIGEGLTLTVEIDPTDMQCINWHITPTDEPERKLADDSATHGYDSYSDGDAADPDVQAERWVCDYLVPDWRGSLDCLDQALVDNYMYPDYDV